MCFAIYKYLKKLSHFGNFIMGLFAVILIIGCFTASQDQRIYPFLMFLWPIIGFANMYYARRMIFSKIYIDKQGITNRLTTCKPISIAWGECVEIGLGKMPMGYGLYNVGIYFSKEPIPQKLRDEVQRIKLNDKHLWMQYDESAMEEVLKYVDESQIHGNHLRPSPKKQKS